MPPDVDRMASAVVAIMKASQVALLERIAVQDERIKVLESRALIPGPPGPEGKPGANGTDGAEGRPGPTPAQVKALVDAAVAELPKPQDGEKGRDGVSVDPIVVDAMVAAHVEIAVKAIPIPQDGKSVTVEEVTPLIESEVAKAVARRPVPKDGVGLTGALLDRSGHLVLTLSDGSTKDIGLVVGRDIESSEVERLIVAQLSTWPKPADGKNGIDGFGFDDLSVVEDDGRQVLRFTRGDQAKEFKLHTLSDRGVYRPGNDYLKGDGVTWDGSFWIAQADTTAKPGGSDEAARAWRLAVKKGREGKPGTNGTDGAAGTPGRHGRDLTAVIDPITGRRP